MGGQREVLWGIDLFLMFVFPVDLLYYSINTYTYFFTSLMYMLQLYCGYNFVF